MRNRAKNIWGPLDISKALDVSVSTVYKWRTQDSFPDPIGHPSNGTVWDAEEVRRWRRRDLRARRQRRAF